MENKYLKLITLGHTETGKTYYLGSLYKLSFEPGPKGFSLQNKAFHQRGIFQDIWGIVSNEKIGAIPSTMELRHAEMVLKKGVDTTVLNILVTDVEGQAMEPGRSTDTAEKIIKTIGQYDGLLLFLKAPKDKKEYRVCQQQLSSILNFASELLSKSGRKIPVVLILNQIDSLPRAEGIRSDFENELNELRSQLEKEYRDRRVINTQVKSKKGEILSHYVKQAIETDEIDELIEQFYRWIHTSKAQIANRIFLSTSLGFDNTKQNPEDTSTLITKFDTLEPYGSTASFLWILYARLQLGLSDDFLTMLRNTWKGTKETLASELLEDIRALHNKGEAYFDNDSSIWNIRSLSELYPKGL